MDMNFLEFEQPIAELQAKIEELRLVGDDNEINIQDEIKRLEKKSRSLTESIVSSIPSYIFVSFPTWAHGRYPNGHGIRNAPICRTT